MLAGRGTVRSTRRQRSALTSNPSRVLLVRSPLSSVAAPNLFTVTPADTGVTNTDAILRTLLALRTPADTGMGAGGDSIAAPRNRVRAISDTITLSDALARVLLALRSPADTGVTISDSITRTPNRVRAPSDSVTISDSLARTLLAARALSDTATPGTDSIARIALLARALSDSITISDSIVGGRSYLRTLTDTGATVSDSIVRQLLALRALTETLVISDSISGGRSFTRSPADTAVTQSDSIVRTLGAMRAIADTLAFSDAILRVPVLRNLTERAIDRDLVRDDFERTVGSGAGTPDLGAAYQGNGQGAANASVDGHRYVMAYTTGDSVTFTMRQNAAHTDVFAEIDYSVSAMHNAGNSQLGFQLRRTGSVTDHGYFLRMLTTPAGAITLSMGSLTAGTFTTIATASPGTMRAEEVWRVQAMMLGFRLLARAWRPGIDAEPTWQIDAVDPSTLYPSGDLNSIRWLIPTASTNAMDVRIDRWRVENLSALDSLQGGRSFSRSITDTAATITDSIATVRARLLADTAASVSDAVTRLLSATRLLSDATGTTDTITRQKAAQRAVAETITISDTIARALIALRLLSDSSSVSDGGIVRAPANRQRTLADTGATVSDSVAKQIQRIRAVLDTAIAGSDSIIALRLSVGPSAYDDPVGRPHSSAERSSRPQLIREQAELVPAGAQAGGIQSGAARGGIVQITEKGEPQ